MKENGLLKKFIIILIVLSVIVLILTKSCRRDSHGKDFVMEIPSKAEQGSSNIKAAHLYVDFSGSMRGFIDMAGYGDNAKIILRSVMSDGLTNLYDKYGNIPCLCHCGKEVYNPHLFIKKVSDNSIFNQGSTLLHEMLNNYCEDASDTSLTIIVSDMVLSYGKKTLMEKGRDYNKLELSGLGSSIYNTMTKIKKRGLHIVLLQYYSDFNGKYYCNCTENIKSCEFRDTIMRKRPFYIMLVGSEKVLRNVMYNDIFTNFDNVYATFGLLKHDTQEFTIQPVGNSKSVWAIGEDNSMGCVWSNVAENDEKGEFEICCDKYTTPKYIKENPLLVYDDKTIASASILADDNKQIKYKITLRQYQDLDDAQETYFKVVSDIEWVVDASINDDVLSKKDLRKLEAKSFGFNSMITNINKAFRGTENLSPEDIAIIKFEVKTK